jgi:hypothetical protein
LEATVHKLRKPRLIVYNIPEDTLLTQNSDLGLTKGDIVAKFDFTTKHKNRNLVIEVEAKVRKTLAVEDKTRMVYMQSKRLCHSNEVFSLFTLQS